MGTGVGERRGVEEGGIMNRQCFAVPKSGFPGVRVGCSGVHALKYILAMHSHPRRWTKIYCRKFFGNGFSGVVSVVSVGDKDEDGAVFAGDLDRLDGGGALVEQIDAQRARSFSALVRMAKDWTVFTARQDEFSCERLEECGRMTGGWLKPGGWPMQVARAKDAKDAKVKGMKDDEMARVVVEWAFAI